jgi:sugar lactone lactonase YvrE
MRLIWCGILACSALAAENWTPLFNGRDFTGWTNVNCAPNTWTMRDGIIVSTGVPTGVLRTLRQYENFILELEWKHLHKGGNAGLFVWSEALPVCGQPFTRSIEVQILDGRGTPGLSSSHGDVFAIQGATMMPDRPHPRGWMRSVPSENRARSAGEWNHYRVECKDGRIALAVNGKFVSGGSNCVPRKGFICLESEGSECHFRNLRIQELPGSVAAEVTRRNPPPDVGGYEHQIDEGFRSLYTGVDLSGWKQDRGHTGHWVPKDWILEYDGKSEAADPNLWTEKEYGDFVLIVDWRFTRKPVPRKLPIVLPNGSNALNDDNSRQTVEVPDAGDSGIYLRGNSKSQVNIWCWPIGSGEVYGYREDLSLPAEIREAVTPKMKADKAIGQWNRFRITMKGDRLTVVLNEKTVIENAQLPGVPPRGPIALQHHNDPIQFANLYIKELSGSRVAAVPSAGIKGPFHAELDNAGNMYFVEMTADRLCKLDSKGAVTVLDTQLDGPHNLALAPDGAIYIADTWKHRVQKFDPKAGTSTTIAGTGEKGFSGDGESAMQATFDGIHCVSLTGDNLYLADLANRRIRVVNVKTGTVKTVAGNGQKGVPTNGAIAVEAPLVDPRAVIADEKENIYILERSGNALRMVDPSGKIRTLAGTGQKGFSGDDGDAKLATFNGPKHLCFDRHGNILIADTENHVIRKYIKDTGKIVRVAGSGKRGKALSNSPLEVELNQPHGVYVHKDGTLCIADSSNDRILKVESN